MRMAAALALACLLVTPGASPAAAAGAARPTLLVARVELLQLAPPDQRYDQAEDAARAAMLGRRIQAAARKSAGYRVLGDAGQVATPPYRYTDCRACMADWARAQGADYVLVTWVQKESRLILMVNMALIDVHHPERHARGGSIDLRGDTDTTWLAGAGQLLDRTLGVALSP